MGRIPELRSMKASSLKPELYNEISEFFSSVKPDFAISGRMSLYTIYNRLKGAKERLRAKRLKRAEELIRAICAAAEAARDLRAGRMAGAERNGKREGFTKKNRDQPTLTLHISMEIEAKFAQLGITDRKAMERVLSFIGEEEFSKRHASVLSELPERAYRPFFSSMPDFLTTPRFYEALSSIAQKMRIIDRLAEKRGGAPIGLDYTRDPQALLLTMQHISAAAKLDKVIGEIRPAGMGMEEARRFGELLTDPEMLRSVLERAGFASLSFSGANSYACIRKGRGGALEGITIIDKGVRYSPATVSIMLSQAGVTGKDLKEGLFA